MIGAFDVACLSNGLLVGTWNGREDRQLVFGPRYVVEQDRRRQGVDSEKVRDGQGWRESV